MSGGRRERGYSLAELAVAMALLGAVVLIGTGLTQGLLRHMASRRPNEDRYALTLGAVPQLREDLRRCDGVLRRVPGLHLPPRSLILDRSGGSGTGVVVWSAQGGRLARVEYRREGRAMVEGGQREWSGKFDAELRLAGPEEGGGRRMLRLDVSGEGGGMRFLFGVRE